MSEVTDLQNQVDIKTGQFVALTLATCGFYLPYWMLLNTKKIEEITKAKIMEYKVLFFMIGLSGWGASVQGIPGAIQFSLILSLAASAIYIYWAFKARKAIQEYALNTHKIDLPMNAFYTFILGAFYINYCINDLPDVMRKKLILTTGNQ